MKKLLACMALLACMFVPAGCTKEEDHLDDGLIEIFAESMSGNAKVLLDGASSTWVNSDPIRINSDEVNVVKMDGHAYINYPDPPSVNRAVYPALLTTSALTSDVVTLNFPAYYHYRTDGGGHQILELPMAAYSTDNNPLQFKHLTGALYVTVTNSAAIPLTLQSITVSSSAYQLNGNRSIDFRALEGIGGITTGTVDDRKVTMLFDTGHTLASGESVKVMIPVMPVGRDHKFSINVKYYQDGQSQSYSKTQTQQNPDEERDNSLQRNQLGYAPMSITNSGSRVPLLNYNSPNYEINSPLDFKLMIDAIQNQWIANDAPYLIKQDIDMTGIPISTITYIDFIGIIDGGNHTISNLTINSVTDGSYCYCALFKKIGSGEKIKSINFDRLSLRAQNVGTKTLYMAGLIATTDHNTTISNCSIDISSIDVGGATGSVYIGGLIGELSAAATINNCHVTVATNNITAKNVYFGGFISYNGLNASANLQNSSFNGNITLTTTGTGVFYAGGFIGRKFSSNFYARNIISSGSISATSSGAYRFLGAIIGNYASPAKADTDGITKNITLSLNGTIISSDDYGTNR